MSIEPSIGDPNKLTIKPALSNSTFVTGYKHDRLAFRIESKSNTPHSSSDAEA